MSASSVCYKVVMFDYLVLRSVRFRLIPVNDRRQGEHDTCNFGFSDDIIPFIFYFFFIKNSEK